MLDVLILYCNLFYFGPRGSSRWPGDLQQDTGDRSSTCLEKTWTMEGFKWENHGPSTMNGGFMGFKWF